MTRDNLLFVIIGVLLGFIGGFMFGSSLSQRQPVPVAGIGRGQTNPHPQLGSDSNSNPLGQMPEEVMKMLDQVRKEPTNFEAQVKAAELYYQIQRYDDAIRYLLKANRLRPDDFETITNLAMMNTESGHFAAAEEWYDAALVKQPGNITILEGYCAVLLQQGKSKAADAIGRLAESIPQTGICPSFAINCRS